MARTFVEAGRRRQFTPTLDQRAGWLVWKDGFYGVINDDTAYIGGATAIARDQMHILDGVWDLPYGSHASAPGAGFDASLVPAGAKVYARPIHQASTLQLQQNAASLAASAVAIGRVWATAPAGATFLRVVLFGPENQY